MSLAESEVKYVSVLVDYFTGEFLFQSVGLVTMKIEILVLTVVFLSCHTLAQGQVNQTFSENTSEIESEPGTEYAYEGNVLNVSIEAPSYTANSWTGVFGNVTSQYIVGQSSESFFSWSLSDARYVYASSQPLDFSSDWSRTHQSYMESEYGFLADSPESVSETFNETANLSSSFQSDPVNETLASSTLNNQSLPYWKTLFLNDGDGGFFAGEVRDGVSFEGSSSDYQLILPENGDEDTGTSYSLYLELE